MTASSTNNVYLDTGSSCAPAVKTAAFTGSDIPIAQVTATSSITAISDLRTMFFSASSSGGLSNVAMPAAEFSSSITGGVETVTKNDQNPSYFWKAMPNLVRIPFPVQVSPVTCTFNGTPPFTCPLNGPTQAGSLMLVIVDSDGANCSTLIPTATDSASDVYSSDQCNVNGGQTIADFYFPNIGAGVSSVIAGITTSPTVQMTITAIELGNVATSSAFDTSTSAAYFPCSSGVAVLPAITTTNASDVIVASATSRGGNFGAFAGIAPFLLARTITDPTNNFSNGTEYTTVTATGTYTPTIGCPGGGTLGLTVAFKALTTPPSRKAAFLPAFVPDFQNIAIGPIYNGGGLFQNLSPHLVSDSCTLGTNCSVTLAGPSVFTNSGSYQCTCTDRTSAAACEFVPSSGSAFTLTGTGTDVLGYVCVGD
jgi:hypothetical protein